MRGIDQQITKAENAVAGRTPVKRTRYVRLTGAATSVNRTLEATNRALAGIKGLHHQPAAPATRAGDRRPQPTATGGEVLPDVQNRPGRPADLPPHPRLDRAHLIIVFAALAVSRRVENTTGWSIKRFVTTARRYRTIQIQAGQHTITAADPLPDDLHAALDTIHGTH